MELNEIGYTEADAEGRKFMERMNNEMKRDLLAAFPRIVQDQTPKYNKAFNGFNEQFLFFPVALKTGAPCEATLGVAILALAAAGVVVIQMKRRTASDGQPPQSRPEPEVAAAAGAKTAAE